MSDYNGSKPIMTVRDNETKIILVDGASSSVATKILSIVGAGDAYAAGTNDMGPVLMGKDTVSGNAIILPVPLPITDNGGAITVDASSLDIRPLAFATDTVDVSGSSVTVTATNLDIRDLAFATDTVDVSGSAVTVTGSVSIVPAAGLVEVCDYHTTATVGVGSEILHMYVVPTGKTFTGFDLLVGARGAVKVRFGISTLGVIEDITKGVYFQDPKENRSQGIKGLVLVGDGTKAIAVGITNLDGASSDVFSTLQGWYV